MMELTLSKHFHLKKDEILITAEIFYFNYKLILLRVLVKQYKLQLVRNIKKIHYKYTKLQETDLLQYLH